MEGLPLYQAPKEELRKSSGLNIPYQLSLRIYKKKFDDSKWVYIYIENSKREKVGVVIYDRYPKADYHLLLLPLLKFGDNISQFEMKNYKVITSYHSIARIIASHLSRTYNRNFIIGYHGEPSMEDLHIHIISDDVLTKKNKSFNEPMFYTIDRIEQEFLKEGHLNNLPGLKKRKRRYKLISNNNYTDMSCILSDEETPENSESPENPRDNCRTEMKELKVPPGFLRPSF